MKDKYSYSLQLRCVVCGGENHFDYNEDKSYIKCANCGKEYFGGYDELVSCNQDQIDKVKKIETEEIGDDLQKELNKMLKDIFKGNKYIKIK